MTLDRTAGTDFRLLMPVAAAWVTAWVTPLVGWPVLVAVGLLCCGGMFWNRRRIAVFAVLLTVITMSGCMGFRVFTLDHGPLAVLAQDHRMVHVSGVATSDPVFVQRPAFGGESEQVRVDVRVGEVSAGNSTWQVRSPVLVLGDASGWQDVEFGTHVLITGTLTPAEGTSSTAAVLLSTAAPRLLAPPGPLLEGAERMRRGLRDALVGAKPDAAGLLPGLVVGDTSKLSPQLVGDLRASGLTHLTAVSGANVAIVLLSALVLARALGVRGYALSAVGLASVGWFVLLARPQPSVLRAAVMGALGIAAVIWTGRRRNPTLLLAAVLLLLLIDPWLARSWGFALSVAATAGLVLLAGRWRDRLVRRGWPGLLADGVAVAAAAQVTTLPLVVALSGTVSLVAIPANLLAAPAVAPATVLGVAAAGVSVLSPRAAHILAWCGQWPAQWIATVAHASAGQTFATAPWPHGWGGAIASLLTAGVVLALFRWLRRQRWWTRRLQWAAVVLVIVLAIAVLRGPVRWPPPGWLMVACDVGQGDGLVVATTPGHALVVDVGPDPALMDRCLSRLNIDTIDLLVLTHFHLDHVGGITGALDGRQVGGLLVSALADPPEQVVEVAAATRGIPAVTAAPGQFGAFGSVQWQVFGPLPVVNAEGSAPNNASVVLKVETHGVSLLLAGDVEPPAQQALVASGEDLTADVLKIPHHGSSNQDPDFWNAVHPRVAVVSVGVDNTYGHPDPELMAEVEQAGVLVGRTDEDGSLAVVLKDGELRLVSAP